MKYKKTLLTGSLLLIIALACIFNAFAHSGRTDGSGGHRDNQNKSGLGSYHYHCGGYPAHLHTNGVCPYKSGGNSSSNSSSKTTLDDLTNKYVNYSRGYDKGYEDGKADGYDEGYDVGYKEGYNNGYDEQTIIIATVLAFVLAIVIIVLIVKFIKNRRRDSIKH